MVTRDQLHRAGAAAHDLKRFLRRRLLTRVHPGVFVDHTGALTRRQEQWAAVLACGEGAALCLLTRGGPVVHVAVDHRRRPTAPPGVRLHRISGLEQQVRSSASPPRLLPEHDLLLALDLARDEEEVVRLVSDAVRDRSTTVDRIRAAAAGRARLRRRRLVEDVLADVERGTHSVLEHRYLTRVERAHGLPVSTWQRRRAKGGRVEYDDGSYSEFSVEVALDGRTGHQGWDAENRDARRDLDRAAEGLVTVRLRHRQVFRDACATARDLALLLRSRGWSGTPQPCGPGCVVGEVVVHQVDQVLPDRAG